MAKRKKGSNRDRSRMTPKLPPPSARNTTGIRIVGDGDPTKFGPQFFDIKIKNFGTGIHNDGGNVNLDGIEIEDCGTGILQERGNIRGKDVTIRGPKD
jgi:hypothetical protein